MAYKKDKKIKTWKIVVSFIVLCALAVALVFADQIETMIGYKETFASHQTTLDKIEESDYYVSYIDVGQGNSSFVKLPDGKTMLIDGGDKEFGETVAEFLTDRDITQIDYLIATHSDSDHIAGLNYVLENFEFKQIYRPFQISRNSDGSAYEYEDLNDAYDYAVSQGISKISKVNTAVYRTFIKNIYDETYTLEGTSYETKICVFYDGLKISGENYEIEFFGPLKTEVTIDFSEDGLTTETEGFATIGYGVSEANGCSSIFTLTCYDDKYLFMGDVEFTEDLSDENYLEKDYSEVDFILSLTDDEKAKMAEVDVLMLPHHGSKYGACEELLDMVLPRFVVVSAGSDNKYGHPHQETIDRLAGLNSLESDYMLRTDEMGDVIFSSVDGELNYYIEKQGTQEKLTISFRMLCVIIAVVILMLIFSIRPLKRKKSKKYYNS